MPIRVSHSLRLGFVFAFLAIAALYGPSPAGAAQAIFTPSADAYVDAAQPRTNFGPSTSLATQGSPEARSYFKFLVTNLTGTVSRATLRVHATSSGPGASVHPVADTTWRENRIRFRNAPPLGAVAASVPAFASGAWIELDVTSLVAGNATYSFGLTSTGARATYASRETGATAPQLVVETGATADPMIAAAGDIACDPTSGSFNGGNGTATQCRHQYTSNIVVGGTYAAVLGLGDLQYEQGTLSQFNASYNPWWGRFKASTRPAVGNHEYETNGAAGYYSYFGPAAGDPAKGYYSFDVGTWHLIALNSNCGDISGGCGAGSPQEQWLRADLASHSNTCTLAYWHHPRFSSGNASSSASDAFWRALYEFNADVVLVGHDHLYERFAPQTPNAVGDPARGIRQFTVGTGGKSLFSFTTVKPNSQVRHNQTYGILELVLHPSGYDWRFVPEAGQTFTDTGSTACH